MNSISIVDFKVYLKSVILFLSEKFLIFFFLFDALSLAYYASAFYPGYLTPDSLYILAQGVGDQPVSNWHPPFVTITWGWLYGVFKSAGGIWILQVLLLMGAATYFSAQLKNKLIGFICLLLIILCPPIFTNMGALWKDDWAVAFSLLCAGFAMRSIRSNLVSFAHLAGIFFVLTSLTRVDYIVIVLPFVIAVSLFFSKKEKTSKWHYLYRFKLVIFYVLVFAFASQLLGYSVEKKLNPWAVTAVWDIEGVQSKSVAHGAGYRCDTSDPLVFGEYRKFPINLPEEKIINNTGEEASNVKRAWLGAVLSHPVAYIKHRACVAKRFFGLDKSMSTPYPAPVFVKSRLTQTADRSELNNAIYWFFDAHAKSAMFRYFYYLLLSFAIVCVAYIMRSPDVIYFLLFASILMSAARVVVLPAADFRYGLWIIVGTIALCAVFADGLMEKFGRSTALREHEPDLAI